VTALTPSRRPPPGAASQPDGHGTVQHDRCGNSAEPTSTDFDLDAYVHELAARAPPLSREQRDKLALLLNTNRRAA
jgi:hypothetical protein